MKSDKSDYGPFRQRVAPQRRSGATAAGILRPTSL